jgi:hypothetical protein
MADPNSDGGPAFPRMVRRDVMTEDGYRERIEPEDGMSLRDYFAGQTLTQLFPFYVTVDPAGMARDAYAVADAMLAERERKG